jgi:hypothetical protein
LIFSLYYISGATAGKDSLVKYEGYQSFTDALPHLNTTRKDADDTQCSYAYEKLIFLVAAYYNEFKKSVKHFADTWVKSI